MLIMMPTVLMRMRTVSFSAEVQELNQSCGARNGKQAIIINRAKTACLVLEVLDSTK